MTAYLDYNASAPLRPGVIEAMQDAAQFSANPSSVHGPGRAARARIEAARATLAGHAKARAEDIVFTSGGTEANNLAIHAAKALGVRRILVSAIEHDAVIAPALHSGLALDYWPVSPDGMADIDFLKDWLAQVPEDRALVCLMAANNETGVIQPVSEVSQIVREANGLLHIDAVQMLGQSSFDFAASGAHFAAVSAHKIGGPAGVGALILSCDGQAAPLVSGGGQEKNRRGGTENLVGIAGFAAALDDMAKNPTEIERVQGLRDRMEYAIKAATNEVKIWGETSPRLNNTMCMSAPGWPSEIQVIAMDLAGYAVSAGAACSSGKVKKSRVLEAMGASEAEASSALRVSLGRGTTQAQVDGFVQTWLENYQRVAGHSARA